MVRTDGSVIHIEVQTGIPDIGIDIVDRTVCVQVQLSMHQNSA
jgi:hypothetical protein